MVASSEDQQPQRYEHQDRGDEKRRVDPLEVLRGGARTHRCPISKKDRFERGEG